MLTNSTVGHGKEEVRTQLYNTDLVKKNNHLLVLFERRFFSPILIKSTHIQLLDPACEVAR